ncbi:MAG: hypothetical protein ACP5LI_00665 [Hydrogenobaculum sp.]
MAKVVKGSIAEALNTSQFSLFHIKAMFASAMGFFTHANLIQSTWSKHHYLCTPG